MKRILGFVLALVLLAGLSVPAAAQEPLKLTMYFPVNVGGSAAQLISSPMMALAKASAASVIGPSPPALPLVQVAG